MEIEFVDLSLSKSLADLVTACESAKEIPMRTLGFLLTGFVGEEIRGYYPRMVKLLDKAAKEGDAPALACLAILYAASGYEGRDMEKAQDYLRRADRMAGKAAGAEGAPDPFSGGVHRRMADIYYEIADGDDEAYRLAFEHYCKALAAGSVLAVYDVGWMYFEEDCESPCFIWSADEMLRMMKAREECSPNPMLGMLLGDIYFEGLRLPADKREAAVWYGQAWEKGDRYSGRQLAECYYDTGQDEEYFGILQELHETGDYDATYRLGECYENGTGVEMDSEKGRQLKEEADMAYAAAVAASEMCDSDAEGCD